MKQLWLALLTVLLVLLGGCVRSGDYLSVTPHEEQYVNQEQQGVLTASSYDELVQVLLAQCAQHQPKCLIRVYSDLENASTDAARAIYHVAKQTALGAYAVDYITYECTQVLSYYEINADITYSRTEEEMQSLITTRGLNAVKSRLVGTIQAYESVLRLRVYNFEAFDVQAYVQSVYEERPGSVQALPEVQLQQYPEGAEEECILEFRLTYPEREQLLREKQEDVNALIRAATEYAQYRDTETEKLQLLYLYLAERFAYRQGTTATPVYSALCEGIADSVGISRAMQCLCDALELQCRTVTGLRGEEPWSWNIVQLDGQYYHIDATLATFSEERSLELRLDSAMTGYSWDRNAYPACMLHPAPGNEN